MCCHCPAVAWAYYHDLDSKVTKSRLRVWNARSVLMRDRNHTQRPQIDSKRSFPCTVESQLNEFVPERNRKRCVISDTARDYAKACAGLLNPHAVQELGLSRDLDLIVKSLA
jgi:hypothetical protein